MRLRPATTLIALTALLAVTTGCSQQVQGTPTAGAAPTTEESSTAPSKKAPANPSTPAAPTTPKTGADKVKIATKKKTTGVEACGVLKVADVEAATGGKSAADGGCIQMTSNPTVMVTQMLTIYDMEQEGETKALEIGGNSARQASTAKSDCQVIVALTDDQTSIMNAFMVSVAGIEEIDACPAAIKLATQAFERFPNA